MNLLNLTKIFNEQINKNIIKKLIFGEKNKINLKPESQQLIETFSQQIYKKNENIINKCLDNFVSNNAISLSNELNDIQTQVNLEKEGNFRGIKNKKQLIKIVSPDIKKSIKTNAFNLGFINYIKIIPSKLALIFSDKIKEHFKHLIMDVNTKNVINSKIKEQFQKILSSIEKIKFKK